MDRITNEEIKKQMGIEEDTFQFIEEKIANLVQTREKSTLKQMNSRDNRIEAHRKKQNRDNKATTTAVKHRLLHME